MSGVRHQPIPAAALLPRHVHRLPYAALVLEGGYEEAGDSGRIRVEPGDILFHGPFAAHQDRMGARRSLVLDLPLPLDARLWPARARSRDPDAVARLAGRDAAAAVRLLLATMLPAEAPPLDLPDRLAADLSGPAPPRIRDWACAQGRAREALSREFRSLYGVAPVRYRAEARARHAWRRIVSGSESLADTAAAVGYADQAHMTRHVRALTGRTPRAWRDWAVQAAADTSGGEVSS